MIAAHKERYCPFYLPAEQNRKRRAPARDKPAPYPEVIAERFRSIIKRRICGDDTRRGDE